MPLFGSPGFGEAADGCCVLFVLGALSTLVAVALVAASRRSASLVGLSFLLAGFVGLLVVPEAINHELRDTDDSRGVHAMLWQFVWWWAASLCAPAAVVIYLFGGPRLARLLDRPEISAARAPAAPDPAESGRRTERTLLRVAWLLALGWGILLVALFAR